MLTDETNEPRYSPVNTLSGDERIASLPAKRKDVADESVGYINKMKLFLFTASSTKSLKTNSSKNCNRKYLLSYFIKFRFYTLSFNGHNNFQC